MTSGVLYISYDGMLEPLGQSQVLAYLERLAPGRKIHLISFEKSEDWTDRPRRQAVTERVLRGGIAWHPLRYHKRPTSLATAYDIAAGSALGVSVALRHGLRIVHARSYVAGVMGLAVKRATGAALLFDMRGFWPEERVDGGLWPADGALYLGAKKVERRLLLAADHIVTLTNASMDILAGLVGRQSLQISVIPTCADLDRFRIQGPLQRDPFVLGHIGAVGTWYLLDEMMRCFKQLAAVLPDARLMIANRGEHDLIRESMKTHAIDPARVELRSAAPADVPAIIARMTAGMAIIKPAYSKIASAPTKLAEYLGCGVPCLGNRGVGDVAETLEDRRVGVALAGFSHDDIRIGIERIVALVREPDIQQRCRSVAEELFALDRGVAAYEGIYDRLKAGRSCA